MRDSNDWGLMLRVLSNKKRRQLLVLLLEQDDGVNILEDVYNGERDLDRLQIEFVHQHLPKLEMLGYIDWDKQTDEVYRGPEYDYIRPVIALLHENHEDLPHGWV